MIDPIDRSMPPAMMTIASPSANSEISEMCRMLLRRLSPPRNSGFSTAVTIASATITANIVSSFLNAFMLEAAERLLLLHLPQLGPERGEVVLVDLLDGGVDERRDGLAVAHILERLHRLVAELERALDDRRIDRAVLDRLQRLLFLVEGDDQRLLRARRRLDRVHHARAV